MFRDIYPHFALFVLPDLCYFVSFLVFFGIIFFFFIPCFSSLEVISLVLRVIFSLEIKTWNYQSQLTHFTFPQKILSKNTTFIIYFN